jgi:hypothetical protein
MSMAAMRVVAVRVIVGVIVRMSGVEMHGLSVRRGAFGFKLGASKHDLGLLGGKPRPSSV